TNLMPDDSLWPWDGGNYKVGFDVWFESGWDVGCAFRFIPDLPCSPSSFHLVVQPPANSLVIVVRFPNWQTAYYQLYRNTKHHIEYEILTDHVKLLIDGNVVLDYSYDPVLALSETGKIALRAGGGTQNLIAYFDNISVEMLEPYENN